MLQRKLPSPGFQVEIVLADYDGSKPNAAETSAKNQSAGSPQTASSTTDGNAAAVTEKSKEESSDSNNDKDDVFSDEESGGGSKGGNKSSADPPVTTATATTTTTTSGASTHSNIPPPATSGGSVEKMTEATQNLSFENVGGPKKTETVSSSSSLLSKAGASEVTTPESQFKAMAADASVFTFGDEDDYESD